MSNIDYNWFVRQPFPVEAVRITEDNLDAVAELIGEVKVKDGERYIAVNRRVIPNISRAFVGYYMTRLGDNLRCYSAKIFREQFIDMPTYQPVAFNFEYGADKDPVVSVVPTDSLSFGAHNVMDSEPVVLTTDPPASPFGLQTMPEDLPTV